MTTNATPIRRKKYWPWVISAVFLALIAAGVSAWIKSNQRAAENAEFIWGKRPGKAVLITFSDYSTPDTTRAICKSEVLLNFLNERLARPRGDVPSGRTFQAIFQMADGTSYQTEAFINPKGDIRLASETTPEAEGSIPTEGPRPKEFDDMIKFLMDPKWHRGSKEF